MNQTDEDALYQIGDVVRLTGVPAATIRFWEARHGLLAPRRSRGGFRLYSADDVETIRRVRGRFGVRLEPTRASSQLPEANGESSPSCFPPTEESAPAGGAPAPKETAAVRHAGMDVPWGGKATGCARGRPRGGEHAVQDGSLAVVVETVAAALAAGDEPEPLAEMAKSYLSAAWCGVAIFERETVLWSAGTPAADAVGLREHPLLRDKRLWLELQGASSYPVLTSLYPPRPALGQTVPRTRLRLLPVAVAGEVTAALCVCDRWESEEPAPSADAPRSGRTRRRTRAGRAASLGDVTPDGLTSRELDILRLLAAGKSSKEIAPLLAITDKTVRNHLSNIYRKLRVYDRVQALLYAVKNGLVQLGQDQGP